MAEVPIKIPALDKLIEVTASGIGAVAGPVIDRLTARMRAETRRIDAGAEADALRIKAKAEAESLVIKTEGQSKAIQHIAKAQENARLPATTEVSIDQEIAMRVQFQEQKRQANILDVVSMAAEELGEKEVPDRDVDHDWTARFFSDVQDVTSEQMQRIWARILSGEVETPGRTSLHTLAILKNMSQRDAEMFARASRFVLNDLILTEKKYTGNLDGFPLFGDIMELESYGLFSTDTFLHTKYQLRQSFQGRPCGFFRQHDMVYGILSMTNQKEVSFPCHLLTAAGQQLYSNVSVEMDESYMHSVARYLRDEKKTQLIRAPMLGRNPDGQSRASSDQFIDVLTGDPVIPAAG